MAFAVFHADFAQPTTEKQKANVQAAKANTEWALHTPSITVHSRKKPEFCGFCEENKTCEKWRKNREMGKKNDSLLCYQKVEDNIACIQKNGNAEFEKQQKTREKLLKAMIAEFNEGRSKTLYCIAATVLEIGELETVLNEAKAKTKGLGIKEKSEKMRSLLNEIADKQNYLLKLRK